MAINTIPLNSIAVKICGITKLKQAKEIADLNVNAIGVIGVTSSTRYLSNEKRINMFTELIDYAPNIDRVWVIADFNDSAIEEGINNCGYPSVIQLHGKESQERCKDLRLRYPTIKWWKAIRIRSPEDLLIAKSYEKSVDKLLFDSWVSNRLGGTGKRVPIEWLSKKNIEIPFWLAGGISADYIPELLSRIKPYGVDASSLLEDSPGIKDLNKVKALIKSIKGVENL